LSVRVLVAAAERDGVRVSLRDGEMLGDADAELDSDALLLPVPDGVAPTDSSAVGDGVAVDSGVDDGDGSTHCHDTWYVVLGATSPYGAMAMAKRLNALYELVVDDVSGTSTNERSPQKDLPTVSSESSLDAMQPSSCGWPGAGQPVPTHSCVSKAVRTLHV
jgi:hypothetical protein